MLIITAGPLSGAPSPLAELAHRGLVLAAEVRLISRSALRASLLIQLLSQYSNSTLQLPLLE